MLAFRKGSFLRCDFRFRSLATCWKCGEVVSPQDLFCKERSCGAVQKFQFEDIDAFQLFQLNKHYEINYTNLEHSYKDTQKLLHPDMFATRPLEERLASNHASSIVNQAYQILKSPFERAQYMLKQRYGVDIFDESKTVYDSELMSDVFELRSQIEDLGANESKNELGGFLRQLEEKVKSYEKHFSNSMERDDMANAIKNAIRLKYYSKMVEEVIEILENISEN